jgi:1-acyl-sn-glycerol-3-phosphate acyltransferase
MATHGDVSPDDLRRFRDALATVRPRQGRFERLLRGVVSTWCRAVGWKLTVSGADSLPVRDGVPGAGCVVAVAPHRAWVEPFLLVAAWPAEAARLVWLADGRTATRSWWRRRLLPRLGVIPISARAGGPRAYAEQAALAVERGCAVVVFPEVGPPSPPARTRALSPGFAYLALRSGAPVVPAVVAGTHRLVRGSPLSVDFCAALEPGEAMPDPLTPPGRTRAGRLRGEVAEAMAGVLPSRTAWADAAAPARARWRWLGTLFD